MLVVDEVQSGFGRTGRFFAFHHSHVQPDVVVVAKRIASGMPLSGVVAKRAVIDAWTPGAHGGTYGGNAVACAAALATLDVIQDEDLLGNARERGAQLLCGLRAATEGVTGVGDVRGLGLMVGIEFVRSGLGDGRVPAPELAAGVQGEALRRRLIVLTAPYGNVIRIVPPPGR